MSEAVEKVRFLITKELIEAIPEEHYETFERLQDGEPFRLYKFRPLAACFVVGEDGRLLPREQAHKELGKIAIGDWKEISRKFMEALQEAALPNANGSRSNSLSEPSSPAPTPSPDGSA